MKVFLSHAASDREAAAELAERLSMAGLEVWRDQGISAGTNFAAEIGRALRSADAMVVLVSRDSMRSEWVQREISYAISETSFRNRVVPVILEPSPNMPWILERFRQVEGRRDDLTRTAQEVVEILHHPAQLQPT